MADLPSSADMSSGDRALSMVAATIIGALGSVPVLAAVGAFPWTIGWAWAAAARTPPRTLEIPLLLWVALAAYVWWLARPPRPALAWITAVTLLLGVAIQLDGALITLRDDPLSGLQGAYVVYVRAVTLAGLAAITCAATYTWVHRIRLSLPLAAAVIIGAGRLLISVDVGALLAVLAGVAIALGIPWIGRLRWPRPRDPSPFALGAILVVAAVARLVLVTSFIRAHGLDFPAATDDGPSYDDLAWMIATGRGAEVAPTEFYFSLYIFVLAPIYALFGHSFAAVGVVQALLAAATAWGTYWIGARVADRAVGLAAATMVALDGLLIWLFAGIGTEAIAVPAVTFSVIALVNALEPRGRWAQIGGAATGGALLGLAGIARDVLLGLWVFLAVWVFWAARRSGAPRRRTIVTTAVYLATAAVAFFPFSLYRQRFTTTSEYTAPLASSLGHPELARLGIGVGYGIGPSLAAISAHPADALGAAAHEMWTKVDLLFLSTAYGSFDPVFLVEGSGVARTLEVYFLGLVVLGLVLLARRVRAGAELPVLLLALLAYGVLAHVVLFHATAATRYRAPYDPVLAIAFGLGLVASARAARPRIARAARGGRWSPPSRSTLRAAGARIALVAGSLLALSIAAELILRVSDPYQGVPGLTSYHPRRDYQLTPNSDLVWYRPVTIDRFGFRTDPREMPLTEEKPPGVKRLIVYGDSFTFGSMLAWDDTLPHHIANALAPTGDRWQVINAGVPGYESQQEAEYMRETATRFHADAVVLQYTLNDALYYRPVEPDRGITATLRPIAEWLRVRSYLFHVLFLSWYRLELQAKLVLDPAASRPAPEAFAAVRAANIRPAHIENPMRRRWETFYGDGSPHFASARAGILDADAFARSIGLPLIVAIYPDPVSRRDGLPTPSGSPTFADVYPLGDLDDRVAAVVSRETRAYWIELLDVLGPLPEDEVYESSDHPGGRANAHAGDAIARCVAGALAGPLPDRATACSR